MGEKPSELYFQFSNKKFVYNIMPIENISSVLSHGLLSFDKVAQIKHSSVALTDVQNLRDSVELPNGKRLHSYANMYFSFHNPMLSRRREQSEAICILAFDAAVLDLPGCVITDRNAATSIVRFYDPVEGIPQLDFQQIHAQYWLDSDIYKQRDKKAIKCAEILIPDFVPPSYINSACVVSKEAKDKLLTLGFQKAIYIKPDYFFL